VTATWTLVRRPSHQGSRYLTVLSHDEIDTRRCCLLIVQHAHHGGRRGMLAILLSSGDHEAAGDVAQAQLLR
jgi:hypothetical protein